MLLYGARATVLSTYHRNTASQPSSRKIQKFIDSGDLIEIKDWWNISDEIDLGIRHPIPNYLTSAVDAIGGVRFFRASDIYRTSLTDFLRSNAKSNAKTAADDTGSEEAEQNATVNEASQQAASSETQESAPAAELERFAVILFGDDITIVLSEWKICSLPPSYIGSEEKIKTSSLIAGLRKVDLSNMMKLIARIEKNSRILCNQFHQSGLGADWRCVDRTAHKLPNLVNFAVTSDEKSLDDWFNLLTLSPAWNGSGAAEGNAELRDQELAARICNGLLPDFWHHMPEAVSRKLLTAGTSHALVDAANTARGVRNRHENTSWSVARIGRRSIVRAGAIQNAGPSAVRSYYLNYFYYDHGEITLRTAALVCAQRACLALLRQEIANVARKTDTDFETSASEVQRKLARYATGYFHRSLGLAEQDEFIYRTWYSRLSIDEELQGVTEDVNRLHQLAQASRQDKTLAKQEAVADATAKLSTIALLGSLGAVITGIFGMNMAVKTLNNLAWDGSVILLVSAGVLSGSLGLMRKLLPKADDDTALVFRGIAAGSRWAGFAGVFLLIAGGAWQMVRPPEPKPDPQEVICLPPATPPVPPAPLPGEPPKG